MPVVSTYVKIPSSLSFKSILTLKLTLLPFSRRLSSFIFSLLSFYAISFAVPMTACRHLLCLLERERGGLQYLGEPTFTRRPAPLPTLSVCSSNQGSISPSFYKQLLRPQISKVQKRQSNQAAFCAFGTCFRKSWEKTCL